jgi:hypothetical protein
VFKTQKYAIRIRNLKNYLETRFNIKKATKIADIPINEPIKPTEEVLIKAKEKFNA